MLFFRVSSSPFVVRLPGHRDEKMATIPVRPFSSGMQKRTPEWMVSFSSVSGVLLGGVFLKDIGVSLTSLSLLTDAVSAYSTVVEFPLFTELFGWNAETHRFVGSDMAGSLMTSARVQHSPLSLMIPSGSFAAQAEEAMFRGKIIDLITLVRLGHIQGILQIIQLTLFRGCRFTRFQQQLDRLILHCSILEKLTQVVVFNQKGQIMGFGVSDTDIQHNKSVYAATPSVNIL